MKKKGGKATRIIGRDAKTGRFIPVGKAKKRPATSVVETIKIGKKSSTKVDSKTDIASVIDHHPPPKKKK